MGRIFISYRRADASGEAGRLFDALSARLGRDKLFMDVDSIGLGQDFRETIAQAIGGSRLMLIVIGPDWLSAGSPDGGSRLESETDAVRLEIEAALAQGLPIVPVFVREAEMPQPSALPPTLRSIAFRNGLPLDHRNWHRDVHILVDGIEPTGPDRETETEKRVDLENKFDDATCLAFLGELGHEVLDRALVLFDALSADGRINSVALAERLGLETPRNLSGVLTTPLKRRAKAMDLPPPYDGGKGDQPYGGIPNPVLGDDPSRTYWVDRDGIAERMMGAGRQLLAQREDTVAARIMRAVRAQPGVSDAGLARQLGAGHQHINNEARRLADAGLIERRSARDRAIGNWPSPPEDVAILRLAGMKHEAGLPAPEIAASLGATESGVAASLRALMERVLVESVPGGPGRWRLVGRLRAMPSDAYLDIARLVRAGEWTTYGDVSTAARGDARAAMAVGQMAATRSDFPFPHRMISSDGRISEQVLTPDGRTRDDYVRLLQEEGVRFVEPFRADNRDHVGWDALRQRAGLTPPDPRQS